MIKLELKNIESGRKYVTLEVRQKEDSTSVEKTTFIEECFKFKLEVQKDGTFHIEPEEGKEQ